VAVDSDARSLLLSLRKADGGFPPSPGAASEPEPTALAAIGLADEDARRWLEQHQRSDGGFVVGPDKVHNDSPTPLAALALPSGDARNRAVDYVRNHQAPKVGPDDRVPHNPDTRGWGWTSTTFGWVEPTARSLLALKILKPDAPEIADGNAVLSDRECEGGGWNYGNREVMGKLYEPFLQTTAAGLLGVQDRTDGIRERAVTVIERLWQQEAAGLGLAMASAALHAIGEPNEELDLALARLVDSTSLYLDAVALAWTVIAGSDGLATIRIPR
jgi:hypothetical protein